MKTNRSGKHNANWKGGICNVATTDGILDLPESLRKVIFNKLLKNFRVTKKGCWEWKLSRFNKRYARITVGTKGMLAHKVSYILHNNKKAGSLKVCHTCDNIICINPEHLFLGTNKDNTQDMLKKGRGPRQDGSHNPMAVLDEDKVKEIKEKLRRGAIQRRLAEEYHVSFQLISLIKLGKIWGDV